MYLEWKIIPKNIKNLVLCVFVFARSVPLSTSIHCTVCVTHDLLMHITHRRCSGGNSFGARADVTTVWWDKHATKKKEREKNNTLTHSHSLVACSGISDTAKVLTYAALDGAHCDWWWICMIVWFILIFVHFSADRCENIYAMQMMHNADFSVFIENIHT